MPGAGVGDLDLDAVADALGAHGDAAVGRRVVDRVLDQVEEHALQLAPGCRGPRRAPVRAPPSSSTASASAVGRIASTASSTSSSSRTCSIVHVELAASSRVSSKRSSISAAERAHVGAHARARSRGGLVVDDVVVDRVGEQPQRGDRRAQVVRDGGDEVAPGALLARRAARPWRRRRPRGGRARRGRRRRCARRGGPRPRRRASSRTASTSRGRGARAGAPPRRSAPWRRPRRATAKNASWPETNISATNSTTAAVSCTIATTATTRELAAQAADAPARQRPARAPTSTVAHPSGARIFSVASAASSSVADQRHGGHERGGGDREAQAAGQPSHGREAVADAPHRLDPARVLRGRPRAWPAAGGCGR